MSNMSTHDEPELTADGVRWTVPESAGRFYYECRPEEGTVVLPWTFDVSYKLNGVPMAAEKLAGQQGLVEINVHCIPNPDAKPYYRNNMLLQAATMIDMQDTLSIEAPGAQIQSIGTYKAVLFAALPGEETTFTLRIGSNSFESAGIVLMMIPGTLEQMKQIKDIKEAKDTLEDSADSIYDSLNEMLGVLSGMSGGLQGMAQGLGGLNDTRQFFSSSKGGMYESAEEALSDLSLFTAQLTTLIPHLENGKELIGGLNERVNTLVSDANAMQTEMTDFRDTIAQTQKDIGQLQAVLHDAQATAEQRKAVHDALNADLLKLAEQMGDLKSKTTSVRNALNNLRRANNTLIHVMEDTPKLPTSTGRSGRATLDIFSALEELAAEIRGQIINAEQKLFRFNEDLNKIIKEVDHVLLNLSYFMEKTENMLDSLSAMLGTGSDMTATLQEALSLADTYFSLLNQGGDSADALMDALNRAGDTASSALEKASTLLDDVSAVNDMFNHYEEGTVQTLQDAADMTARLDGAIGSASDFLNAFKDLLRQTGELADTPTQTTLDSLIDVLQRGLDGIGTTDTVKDANRTVKDTLEEQVDKYEEENHLLDLDAEHRMVSFTSDDNPEPASIQVILRTEEISVDSAKGSEADLEPGEENIGFFARVANVFKSIWNAIASVFE